MRIAETIDAFYGDAGTRDGVSRSYKQAVEDLDAETIKALDGPYRFVATRSSSRRSERKRGRATADRDHRATVLDPISRFCSYFPDINECASLPLACPPPSC